MHKYEHIVNREIISLSKSIFEYDWIFGFINRNATLSQTDIIWAQKKSYRSVPIICHKNRTGSTSGLLPNTRAPQDLYQAGRLITLPGLVFLFISLFLLSRARTTDSHLQQVRQDQRYSLSNSIFYVSTSENINWLVKLNSCFRLRWLPLNTEGKSISGSKQFTIKSLFSYSIADAQLSCSTEGLQKH